jgi:imidazolonepropionase-like amidohydrolase
VTATLYRDGALADGRSDRAQVGVSILVRDGVIAWMRPSDDEGQRPPDCAVVDTSGSTIVPGMVDAHSHLTLPGGARWIERIGDPPERLVEVAEDNARLLASAGVRWARDVGSAMGVDPADGRTRAVSLGVRDRWRGRAGYPHVRAAGSWVFKAGTMNQDWAVEAADADALIAAVDGQLDDGADFIKLYLDGPEPNVAPWSIDEVAAAVRAAHARGARVTAHSSHLAGARVGVAAGVDAIEHGMELDADLAADMARRGTRLISTLCIFRSWRTFASTTTIERFMDPERRSTSAAREERAFDSVRLAHAAGVAIATGTDFGGGSTRANQLAWEVECLVDAGLQPWEALGAATWRGGELLGEPEAGVLREGGPADLALVHGDPLSDPTALWRVWHASWAPRPGS